MAAPPQRGHYLSAVALRVEAREVERQARRAAARLAADLRRVADRSAQIKRRVAALMESRTRGAEDGRPVSGPPPFGYRRMGRRREMRMVVVASEAALVRRLFALRAEGKSFRYLAVVASAFTGRDGAPHRKGRMATWTGPGVRYMLRNPTYLGLTRFGGRLYVGCHAAIVSADEWKSVWGERAPGADA